MTVSSLYPLELRASMTMVLADPAVDRTNLPLAAVVELLAESIRNELDDLVWVLHVVWDTGLGPPSVPPTEIRVPLGTPPPNITAFVHAALLDFGQHWGIAFDQILIETSGIDPNGALDAELWAAMIGLPYTTCINYLVDQPEQWDMLPVTLGLLPVIDVQPVALLGPVPEAHVIKTLLVELVGILNDMNPGQAAQQWASDLITTGRLKRWIKRWIAVVTQMYGSTQFQPAPWPINAVRLRFEGDPSLIVPNPPESNVESFSRWARTVTARRVGVAIGGAGAQSYVGIPFIQKLRDAGVPIDIMSGSSTGAFITAFYAALGDVGLARMLYGNNIIGWGVFFALVNNMPLTWWLAWSTHFIDLGELAQPTIAVATSAMRGDAVHMTSGLAGKSLMASGSMPPFVATYIGNTRLLDGGLSQDVPTAVLGAAGASLTIAAQAVPRIMPIPTLPEPIPVPYLTKYAITLNPFVRMWDGYRGFTTLFRQAAFSQEQYAQVFYNATTLFSSAGTWFAGRRIAHEAANSQALQDAVLEAVEYWNELLLDAPGRVRINRTSNEVETGTAVELGFVFDPSIGAWRLSDDASQSLVEIGAWVSSFATELKVTILDPPANPAQLNEYQILIVTASGLPTSAVDFSSTVTGASTTSFTLAIDP
jgi:hypothetical protein